MIQKLIAHFRLHLKNIDFIKGVNEIKNRQYLSHTENMSRQLNQLNKILTHAYQTVPYYQRIFNEIDIVKDSKVELNFLAELNKIPFLDKGIIFDEVENLYSKQHNERGSFKNTSGGSTGKPVTFLQDKTYSLSNRINTQLAYFWRGYTPYDDMVVIWGAERDIFDGKKSFRSRLEDIYLSRTVLNSFAMSEEDMLHYIEVLNKKRPKLIKAYAQSIYEIAKYAKKNNIEVVPQQAIHLAAGTVHESMRILIEEVFSCKAYNYYGSREIGSIASECSVQDGLHIMIEHTLVEIIDENGEVCKPGEQGEIVVTSLANYSMPLIRYRIGDIGILKEYDACSCGCSYPKLERIVGRTTDLFKTKDGKKIDGEYFTHLFYFRDWLEQFQVVQDRLDELKIRIVKNAEPLVSDIEEIEDKIKLVMGNECDVIFEYVDKIEKTLTGKYRYTISNI